MNSNKKEKNKLELEEDQKIKRFTKILRSIGSGFVSIRKRRLRVFVLNLQPRESIFNHQGRRAWHLGWPATNLSRD